MGETELLVTRGADVRAILFSVPYSLDRSISEGEPEDVSQEGFSVPVRIQAPWTVFSAQSSFQPSATGVAAPTSELYTTGLRFRFPVHGFSLVSSTASGATAPAVRSADELRAMVERSEVRASVHAEFFAAREERFEDGFESAFSHWLKSFVQRHGLVGIEELDSSIRSGEATPSVLGEALRVLGRVKDPSTHTRRLQVLVSLLRHRSASVRDAAALGLGFLGDARAIPHLRAACEAESVPELRADLGALLREMEN